MKKTGNVNELFAAPIGVKVVAKLDGRELYGSESLNHAFIKSMANTARAKPLIKTITKMVMEKRIVPCWMNKNLLKLIQFKIFAPAHEKTGMAFFHPSSNKIYVLIDNNINNFGFSSNDWIAELVIHELCHLAVADNHSLYYSTFKGILTEFYQYYFINALKLSGTPNVIPFMNYIYKTYDVDGRIKYSTFKKYKELIDVFKSSTNLSDNQFDLTVRLIVNAVVIGIYNFETFYRNLRNYIPALAPIRGAYRDMVGNVALSINSLVFQELFAPSEVIAILSEINSPYASKIKTGLSKILS